VYILSADGEDCLVTHNDHDIRGGGVRRLSIDKAIETAGRQAICHTALFFDGHLICLFTVI